jgi:serine phosphatase RsbU (regulator of sigma subunit)
MWFTHLAGLLQSYGRPDFDPARIAWEMNRHLCYLQPVAPFVTAFFAQVDCELETITYCNAGHFPPILLRAGGRTELLEQGGPLLGALEGAEFVSGALTLNPVTSWSHTPMVSSNAATGQEKSSAWTG